MPDLKLDDGVLQNLVLGLQAIITDLRDSSSFASDLSALVGDDALASKVDAFASSWSVHRTKMVEGITRLHDAAKAIDDGFTKVDGKLAHALAAPQATAVQRGR